MTQSFHKLLEEVPLEGLLVLDAGTGVGRTAQLLADLSAHKVYSVTINFHHATRFASRMSTQHRNIIQLVVADLRRTPFVNNTFDAIVADQLISALGMATPFAEDIVLAELRRSLKPGGKLVIRDFGLYEELPDEPSSRFIAELMKITKVLNLLTGNAFYSLHPMFSVQAKLENLGFRNIEAQTVDSPSTTPYELAEVNLLPAIHSLIECLPTEALHA